MIENVWFWIFDTWGSMTTCWISTILDSKLPGNMMYVGEEELTFAKVGELLSVKFMEENYCFKIYNFYNR